MSGIWAALEPWLSDLRVASSLSIRSNLAMLANGLADKDADARTALADMIARTCDTAVRTGSAEDRSLLEMLAKECGWRAESGPTALDDAVRERLQALSPAWDAERAVDTLLQQRSALNFLPIPVLVEAVAASARRLIRADAASPEQDQARDRLVRVAWIEAGAPASVRAALRNGLRRRLGATSRRDGRLLTLSLMQATPSLMSRVEEVSIASPKAADAAARAGRPTWPRITLQAVGSASIVAAALTVLVATAIARSGERMHWFNTDYAWGAWARLFTIGLATALPAALLYTPSVGRRELPARTLVRAAWPALGGAVGGLLAISYWVGDTLADPGVRNGLGLVFDDPRRDLAVLIALLGCSLLAAAWLVPEAVRRLRTLVRGADLTLACAGVAGAAAAALTLACEFGMLTHRTWPSVAWAPLVVSCLSAAIVMTSLEFDTLPHVPRATRGRDVRVGVLGLVGACYALVLAPVLISPALHRAKARNEVSVPASGADLVVRVDPGPITFKPDATDPVLVTASVDPPHRIADANTNKFAPTAKFRLSGTAPPYCVDTCVSDWPPMDQWLPNMVGAAATPLRLQVVTGQVIPAAKTRLTLASGPVPDLLEAGQAYDFDVSAQAFPSGATVTASGTGRDGGSARIAVFDRDDQGARTPSSNAASDIRPGKYSLCVYFQEADQAGCDLSADHRVIFEPGTAGLTVTKR